MIRVDDGIYSFSIVGYLLAKLGTIKEIKKIVSTL